MVNPLHQRDRSISTYLLRSNVLTASIKKVSTMNPPYHSSQPWLNPPTPINRYRLIGSGHQTHADVQPASAIQPVQSPPSFRNKSRKRGAVLTQVGWQKLMQSGVLYDDCSRRYTYEELSERSRLDSRTVSRVISCEVKVDKRTLTDFFRAFNLKLEPGDYTTPAATEKRKESGSASSAAVTSYPNMSYTDTATEELMYLRQRLKEDCDRLSNFLGLSEAEKG